MSVNYNNHNLITNGSITASSGAYNHSLTVSGIPVSLDGHSHQYSDITDFGSGVSGLLPTISNSGNNRILTSDGTSTGIVAESGFLFNENTREFKILYDQSIHVGGNADGNIRLETYGTSGTLSTVANRIMAVRCLGTESNPSGLIDSNAILTIRGQTLNSSGILDNSIRIGMFADGNLTGNTYQPTRLLFNTSSGSGRNDNNLILFQNSLLIFDISKHNGGEMITFF